MEQPSIDLVELNPQPLPPDAEINLVALNPQPLPPDATIELVALNPQPLPPQAKINLVALNPQPLPPAVKINLVALNPQPLPPQDDDRLRGAEPAAAAPWRDTGLRRGGGLARLAHSDEAPRHRALNLAGVVAGADREHDARPSGARQDDPETQPHAASPRPRPLDRILGQQHLHAAGGQPPGPSGR